VNINQFVQYCMSVLASFLHYQFTVPNLLLMVDNASA